MLSHDNVLRAYDVITWTRQHHTPPASSQHLHHAQQQRQLHADGSGASLGVSAACGQVGGGRAACRWPTARFFSLEGCQVAALVA